MTAPGHPTQRFESARAVTDRYDVLQAAIGYRFADRALLERAMTHRSAGEGRKGAPDNERLEFLGDRVLGLLAARWLYQAFAREAEGALAPRLNALVRREACARVARAAGIGAALHLGKSEDAGKGRDKDSILADACEALIAALYLDGGWPAAEAFFDRFWAGERGLLDAAPSDPKTDLQTWSLARGAAPVYAVVGRKGPDHRPTFTVEVTAPGLSPATGEGGSKQDAELAAAAALIAREGLDVR